MRVASTADLEKSPATLFLFSLHSEQCFPYERSHNNVYWDCLDRRRDRTAFFIQKLFPPATTAGGQNKLLLVRACVVGGELGLCVIFPLNIDSWTNKFPAA